jgi:hypothetical protein
LSNLWLQKKGMGTNFFTPLSFIAVFGSGIRDPGSGMGKNQGPGSGINIPDPQHWLLVRYILGASLPPPVTQKFLIAEM